MAYKDGEVFESYCDKPYDRHTYKIVFKDGTSKVYDNYEIMRYHWYQLRNEAVELIVCDFGGFL